MYANDLICTVDGSEVPAPGLWAPCWGGRYLDEVVIRTSVIEFTADPAWRTCGEFELDGIVRPLAVDIQYGGVYPAGDEARAWFVVRASLAEGIAGRLRNGPVDLIADVLAVAPSRA